MSFEKNLLERIASYIPGYAGYKEKECGGRQTPS
jgi:hypothetical protein